MKAIDLYLQSNISRFKHLNLLRNCYHCYLGFVVLVGKLVSALDEVLCKDYHLLQSDLMFSDNSGQIPCFVSDCFIIV